ncbi:MAG: amidohydrolase family protein [Gemmatimonadota bacterium]|nr:amidohydrolase family protein [Gemmatimonadota bacterium]
MPRDFSTSFLVIAILAVLLLRPVGLPAQAFRDPGTTAIVNARVIPMTSDEVLEDHAVLVEGERIAWIGPTSELDAPPGTTVIDADGGWVLPGLVDLHVHLDRDDLEAYVRHGVTTVRNMWGFPAVWEMKAGIDSGELLGPTIFTVSSGLDGTPPKWPLTQFVTDPADADSVVALQAENGYRTLKLYQDLTRPAYDAIVEAARTRGLEFVGHVPHRVGLERALEAGQRSLEHLGGFETLLAPGGGRGLAAWARIDRERIPFVAAAVEEAGSAVVPTQAIVRNMQRGLPAAIRGAGFENRARVIRALHEAGVPVLVGTDSGIGVTEPGASMVDEIRELHAAGLSRREALEAATTKAAAFLGGSDEFGAVAVGMRADLLLLEANPLDDLDALARPAGVMARGNWIPVE